MFDKTCRYCFCLLIMHYDDNSFLKIDVDQIMRYKVGLSWSRLGQNCQILSKKEFFGNFKCKIYVPIVPNYDT